MVEYARWVDSESFWVIEINGCIKGTLNYYWEHKPSHWLEAGICFQQPVEWGKGYETRAFKLWITHLFHTFPLVRVGFTTWSGNERMMRVGEKLGMTLEGRIRNVRLYNGVYYDSILMGILREEWKIFCNIDTISVK